MDIGTTGVKSLIMNDDGKILATSFKEYPLYLPHPGWAEQNPLDWWDATKSALNELLKKSKVNSREIRGISFSGQMHGLVCLDKNINVLRPAILWCDQRTTPQCREITKKIGYSRLIRLTSNPALEGFTLPKLEWVKKNEPTIYKKTTKILLPKDYIRFKLTGNLGMEVSDAAGTLMFDVSKRKWSRELLKSLEIDERILPDVKESIDISGEITEIAAKETGLPAGLPVIFGGADNTCAAVGNGIIEEGYWAISIGTSGTVIVPISKPARDPKGRVHTFNHSVPNVWYLMGVMQAAGLSLKWFRDEMSASEKTVAIRCGRDAYEYLCEEASKIKPGAEGLFWLPYLNGERTPHLDSNAKGVLFGVTARHTRAHFIRAILEGVVFGLRDGFEIIKSLKVPIKQIRLTGGGAKSPLWRQIQADVFNHQVVTINVDEGPAFGAAIIAGVGVGVYSSFKEASDHLIKVKDTIDPIPENVKRLQASYKIFQKLYCDLKDRMTEISKLV